MIFSGGHPAVWTKHFRFSDGNGGAAMVHHRMFPCPRQHLDDRECHCSTQRAPPGIGAAGGGGLQRQPRPYRGRLEGGGYRGGTDDGEVRRHFVPLTPATAPMVPGQENLENGPVREGGAVPYGLHHGDVLLSLHERGRPGPTA